MMLQSTPVVRAHRGAFDQLVYPVLCLGDRHETSFENIQVYFSQLTRVYQEALEEGLQQGLEPIRAQVSRRLGTVEPELRSQIQQLSSAQVEELGEALLDFSTTEDLIA